MLLDTIIEPIADLSSLAGQLVAQYIADRSSLPRDGWVVTCIRFVIATVVFLAVGIGVPVLVIALVWWLGIKLVFGSMFV